MKRLIFILLLAFTLSAKFLDIKTKKFHHHPRPQRPPRSDEEEHEHERPPRSDEEEDEHEKPPRFDDEEEDEHERPPRPPRSDEEEHEHERKA